MLVNVYKSKNGGYYYAEPNSEDDRLCVQYSDIWKFQGQKEETLIVPKKKVTKYRWVTCSIKGDYSVTSRYYYDQEDYRGCFPVSTEKLVTKISLTGTLMDEDKNSL
jgi:hypothetical protein